MCVNETIDVLGRKAARPDIDEAVPEAVLDRVGVEVDRRDRQRPWFSTVSG